MAKSIAERIAAEEKKATQAKERIKALKAKQSEEKRKKDAHLKIQLGGTVIKYLGREATENDIAKLDAYLKSQEDRGQYFTSFMNDNN